MLLPDYCGYGRMEDFATLIHTLTWYRMYCAGRFGESGEDYIKGFESLKAHYKDIIPSEKAPVVMDRPILQVFDEIESLLSSKRLTDECIGQIAELLWNFETREEDRFIANYIEYCCSVDAKRHYPKKLYDAVSRLLVAERYDAAVLAAFKFLDSHLQNILGVSPHEYYGEDLVNYAFSPDSGILQLGTHPNEQVGLRNFFSGANALFRNPSAHRFVQYDHFSAMTIIAMVAMMSKIATTLASRQADQP